MQADAGRFRPILAVWLGGIIPTPPGKLSSHGKLSSPLVLAELSCWEVVLPLCIRRVVLLGREGLGGVVLEGWCGQVEGGWVGRVGGFPVTECAARLEHHRTKPDNLYISAALICAVVAACPANTHWFSSNLWVCEARAKYGGFYVISYL